MTRSGPENNEIQYATSDAARDCFALVTKLQQDFAAGLTKLATKHGDSDLHFTKVTWLRDKGRHGGGHRLVASREGFFNTASINVSQVQYESDASKPLDSATALSTIIHPSHPRLPSIHMHISWTGLKGGKGYWRMMADLNPSLPNDMTTEIFATTLSNATGQYYKEGREQGNKYFYIPALNRHRGVSHFYLENFTTGDRDSDFEMARNLGQKVIDTYLEILQKCTQSAKEKTPNEQEAQLVYHTLYFFQVLTLDRGTTSGILVHDQNDEGILGSLPKRIKRTLIEEWQAKVPPPQDSLVAAILKSLPIDDVIEVSGPVKQKLALVLREFYTKYPEAKDLLARGNTVPTTTQNHLGK